MTMFALPAEVTPTPTPSGVPFDPTTVTPGWVGFAITLLVMIATLLLILDMVRRAAYYAGRTVQVLKVAGACPDHPWLAQVQESRYLKAVFCRVLD